MELKKRGIVMIVDDVESEIDILVDILHQDYEICVAMDGASALELATEICPDLILLDILMPDMDGYEVCRRLKSSPNTRDISIIFVTVLSEDGHETTGLELGALDYITKPFNRDIVLARVRNHMELIEMHRLREDVNRIICHDMRNELSTVIGYPDLLLLDDNLTADQKKTIGSIRSAGYNLLNLVNLGLQLYKMERGLYQFRPFMVDVVTVLERVLENKSPLCQTKSVEVKLTLAGEPIKKRTTFAVRSEDLLLYSMLSNLVVNAIEASPPQHSVTINLDKNGEVVISIHNMGAVPEGIRQRFFEKYVTAGKVTGTGLGAYSALLMAKTHGGTIDMQTSDEDGTTVTVRLPLHEPACE